MRVILKHEHGHGQAAKTRTAYAQPTKTRTAYGQQRARSFDINKVSAISARFRGVFCFYFAYWSVKISYGANLAKFQL
jgi:hypothetical protein